MKNPLTFPSATYSHKSDVYALDKPLVWSRPEDSSLEWLRAEISNYKEERILRKYLCYCPNLCQYLYLGKSVQYANILTVRNGRLREQC